MKSVKEFWRLQKMHKCRTVILLKFQNSMNPHKLKKMNNYSKDTHMQNVKQISPVVSETFKKFAYKKLRGYKIKITSFKTRTKCHDVL